MAKPSAAWRSGMRSNGGSRLKALGSYHVSPGSHNACHACRGRHAHRQAPGERYRADAFELGNVAKQQNPRTASRACSSSSRDCKDDHKLAAARNPFATIRGAAPTVDKRA